MTKIEKVKEFVKTHKKQIIAGSIFAGGMLVGVLLMKNHYSHIRNLDDYANTVFVGRTDDDSQVLIGAFNKKTGQIDDIFHTSNVEAAMDTAKSIIKNANVVKESNK